MLGLGQCNIFCLGKATATAGMAAGAAWLAAEEALAAGWSRGWRRVYFLGVKMYPSVGSCS